MNVASSTGCLIRAWGGYRSALDQPIHPISPPLPLCTVLYVPLGEMRPGLLVVAAAAWIGGGGAAEENRCAESDAEVLILGAGMAGISAAKTLSEGNVTNFLVLEAENRIGGRVKNTLLQSGVRVELGANWIQGIDPHQPEKHPLWQIAQRCGGLE